MSAYQMDHPFVVSFSGGRNQINIQPELFGATSDEDNEIIPCTCTD